MWNWIKQLFQQPLTDDEQILNLKQEVQSLQLELAERNQLVDKLKQELERQRHSESERLTNAVQTQVEQLLTDTATPIAQLTTQAHLLSQDKPVQAKDVLAVAKRLIGVLEDNGLILTSSVGETVSFDSNLHDPLSASTSITTGKPVVVKFAGVSYQGKIIRKAGVEPCQGV